MYSLIYIYIYIYIYLHPFIHPSISLSTLPASPASGDLVGSSSVSRPSSRLSDIHSLTYSFKH